MTKIKPCPFCGFEQAKVVKHEYSEFPDSYGVVCKTCYSSTYQFYETEEQAIKAWNKRDIKKKTAERKKLFFTNEFETQIERFLEIRKRLFKKIGENLEEECGKSYEGEFYITMCYPNYYDDDNCLIEKPCHWVIHLDCYIVGPHRHYDWTGKTLKEALDKCDNDISSWLHNGCLWLE